MPSSGGGTVTPIPSPPGPAPSDIIYQPLPLTILSLNMYTKIMGINPAHFWGGTAHNLVPSVMPVTTCSSIWHHYPWQDADKVSRYDIVVEIAKAEADLAQIVGYYPGPVWVNEEKQDYPRVYRREYFGAGGDIRGLAKNVKARWGKIIQPGERAVSAVASATTAAGSLAYSDEDGDGFYETAIISVATTLTEINEIKVYQSGQDAKPETEIREPRKKYISGGFAYFIFDSWLFINPELYEVLPTELGEYSIDFGDTTNFLGSVDVYREYVDTTERSCEFYWENAYVGCAVCGGSGCDACGTVTQDGCLRVRNYEIGELVPVPASYDATDGWSYSCWDGDRDPDTVGLWYQCGLLSDAFVNHRTSVPVPIEWARVIARLATSRLERPMCGCTNVEALSTYLRTDTTRNEGAGGMFFTTVNVVNSPLGTRIGEVEAWRFVAKLVDRIINVAVI